MSLFHPLIAAALLVPALSFAATARGEKDVSDVLREARTHHILFTSEQDAASARARLEGKAGQELFAAFQAMARAESKDPGSAASGGDLGVVEEGVMVRSFEQALFAMPPHTVSGPVKSEFGWHLIYAYDFKETSVAQICASSLARATDNAKGRERDILARSGDMARDAHFAASVAQLIGEAWGAPLKDAYGDLAFVQILPVTERATLARALVHLEYGKPVLALSPRGCRRSVRQELEIDCEARLVAPTARSEYEGRAATGRVLVQLRPSAAERRRAASNVGFHAQLLASACPKSP